MKRVERMRMVERAVEDLERKRAEKLAASERQVAECEGKLLELQNYHESYTRQFQTRAGAGIGGAGLRDYQAFLARLAEAVRQQAQLVLRAQTERDIERKSWQGAAQRARAVGRLVKRWQTTEHRLLERNEQRESDERSQQPSRHGVHARGA